MPMRWDDRTTITFCMKIFEQNPNVLSSTATSTDLISSTWPDANKPTPRACEERIKAMRKNIKNLSGGNAGCGPTPATPSTKTNKGGRKGNSQVAGRGPRTPTTPMKRLFATTHVDSTGRRVRARTSATSTPTSQARSITPLTKSKHGIANRHTSSDTDPEGSEIKSSDEMSDGEETSSDNEETFDSRSIGTEHRKLARRSKSRSKSYVQEAGSSGEDAAAKEMDSSDEFCIDGGASPDVKRRALMRILGRGAESGQRYDGVSKNGEEFDGVSDVEIGGGQDIGENASKRSSYGSENFHDALEDAE